MLKGIIGCNVSRMTPDERQETLERMQDSGWKIVVQQSADPSKAPGNVPDSRLTRQWQARGDLSGVDNTTVAGYGDTRDEAVDEMLSEWDEYDS